MTLDEWMDLCPKDCGAMIFSSEGHHILIPNGEFSRIVRQRIRQLGARGGGGSGQFAPVCEPPSGITQSIILCVGILATGNEDLQELVLERVQLKAS